MIDTVPTAIITNRPVLAHAWSAAVPGCTVLAVTVEPHEIAGFRAIVFEVNGLDDVSHLLPVEHAMAVWVHAGIGPTELRRARTARIDVVVHRELGLAAVHDALDGAPDAPSIRRIGAKLSGPATDELSIEEVMVLRLLSRGATVAQVRRQTGFSASRVERCRQGALRKLGAHTTGQGLARAAELGLITAVGSSTSG
jgi:DNA-binding CsgD family transcriptional regulator